MEGATNTKTIFSNFLNWHFCKLCVNKVIIVDIWSFVLGQKSLGGLKKAIYQVNILRNVSVLGQRGQYSSFYLKLFQKFVQKPWENVSEWFD